MRRIVYRPSALEALVAIHDYIAVDDPHAAKRVVAGIRNSISYLAQFEYMGRPGVVPNTRELVVPRSRYIVAYEIREDIEIIKIYHGRQVS